MHRLGFELVSPAERRRRNLKVRGGRALAAAMVLALVILLGLYEGAQREQSPGGTLPEVIERSVGARAQIFHGLSAPLERLEELLDRTISSESGMLAEEPANQWGHGIHGDSLDEALEVGPPRFNTATIAPFPSS